LFRGRDFHDAAAVPISRTELAQLVDAIDDARQDFAFPAARLAGAADAIKCVPAAAVHFPRHFRGGADFLDFEVFFAWGLGSSEIMRLPLDMRPGGENRRERLGGMRS